MIHESCHWKEPLIRSASWLERIRIGEDTSEQVFVQIENRLFIGFYSIRKLLDTFKVSDATKRMPFKIEWSPGVARVDYLNNHRFSELFDLKKVNSESRDLEFLCNRFIHSYIFAPVEDDSGRLCGVYVCSDRDRGNKNPCDNKIYFVKLEQIVAAFRKVGGDYPASASMCRNPATGQWEGTVQ
jgi:hypothetical protein